MFGDRLQRLEIKIEYKNDKPSASQGIDKQCDDSDPDQMADLCARLDQVRGQDEHHWQVIDRANFPKRDIYIPVLEYAVDQAKCDEPAKYEYRPEQWASIAFDFTLHCAVP